MSTLFYPSEERHNWELSIELELTTLLTLDKHSETRRQHLPDAAAVLCLQGKLWHAHKDLQKAIDCYVEALKLNPFLWDAFLGLCETGTHELNTVCCDVMKH